MRDEDDGHTAAQRDERILQIATDDRIERAERLVAQKQRRFGDHRPDDADALLLAAGERARIAIAELGHRQIELRRHLLGRRARFALGPAEEARDSGDVLVDGAVREESRTLNDVAGAAAKGDEVRERERLALDNDIAARRPRQAVNQPQRRRFARSAPANERDRLAGRDAQIDIVQNRTDRYTAEFDGCGHRRILFCGHCSSSPQLRDC